MYQAGETTGGAAGSGSGTSTRAFRWRFAIPFIAVHCVALAAPFFFTWSAFALMVALNLIFGTLGVSLGYHRLLAHGSYSAPRWFEYVLVTIGVLAMQGAPISWSGMHRRHHQVSDEPDDPHSSAKGFWWSHIGWAFRLSQNDYKEYALERVRNDRLYRFYDRHPVLLQVPLGIVLYLLGGWPFFFWGVFVRIIVLWHSTFLVNSATHKWGYRNYETKDNSRNTWWVALLSYGEGWHNNHHAHPKAAKFTRRWWEFDIGWQCLRLFRSFRLVRDVTAPRS